MSHADQVEAKLTTPNEDPFNKREGLPRRLSSKIVPDTDGPPEVGKQYSGGCCGMCQAEVPAIEDFDVVLIGGGIMSATLGMLLKQIEPSWKIVLYERLGAVGEESSNGWNNAGTGHSALCELNYTKEMPDGSIDHSKALSINEQFQLSRQFWAYLANKSLIQNNWIQSVAHMSFVTGEKNVAFLQKRYDVLKKESLFNGMEHSDDPNKIKEWAPLLIKGRNPNKKFAATHMPKGTDVDFGTLTKQLVQGFIKAGGAVYLYNTVTGLKKEKDSWLVTVSKYNMGSGSHQVRGKFVFCGAGGWAILLLQKAGIPGVRGYAGGPVSGQFLVCQNPAIVQQHQAKVYTKGEIGAPPMSEPHLDARIIEGKPLLLFGPYAGLSTRFLKTGTLFDAFKMIRFNNLIPLLGAAIQNFDLVIYLLGMLLATKKSRMADLHQLMPSADPEDWTLITAGMRVQVIKKDPKTGKFVFQFGTEVVFGPDLNICGLLGASPGASTAVQVCLDILQKCYKSKMDGWKPKLTEIIPSFGKSLAKEPDLVTKLYADTAKALEIKN